MAGGFIAVEAFDPRGAVLLAEVTAGAQSLAVLEAGRPALGEGHDVVHVAHGSVAEGSAAGVIPPDQEASQRRRELTAPGFDTDQLAHGRVGVEATQRHTDLWTIRAVPILGGLIRLFERRSQLLAHRLDGHRPVPLEVRDVIASRIQQGAVGDDQSDIQGHGLHRALAPEHRVREGIGHQRSMPRASTLGATALRLEGEALVGEPGVQRGQMDAEGGHAVLARREADVTMGAGRAVPVLCATRVKLSDRRRDSLAPALHPCAVELRHLLDQVPVQLPALEIVQRGGGGRRGVRHGRGDLAGGQRTEHPGHGGDQAPRGGHGAVRDRGRAARGEGDVLCGLRVGLRDELLEGRQEVVLMGGVILRGMDGIAGGHLGEGDHRAHFEHLECAARGMDHVEQVLVLGASTPVRAEHGLRSGCHLGEQVVDVPQQLRERGRPACAQRGEGLLRGRLCVRRSPGRRGDHGSRLPHPAPLSKAPPKNVDSPGSKHPFLHIDVLCPGHT